MILEIIVWAILSFIITYFIVNRLIRLSIEWRVLNEELRNTRSREQALRGEFVEYRDYRNKVSADLEQKLKDSKLSNIELTYLIYACNEYKGESLGLLDRDISKLVIKLTLMQKQPEVGG